MRTPLIWIVVIVSLIWLVACASSGDASATGVPESEVAHVITHPELRDQLNDLFRRDQRARKAMLAAMREAEPAPAGQRYAAEAIPFARAAQAIDTESTEFLKSMIVAHGWPTFDMVGEDGANSAWLLAQHADAHPALQKKVLELMRPLVVAGQAKPSNLAYLTDRVLVADKKQQIYGTQFGSAPDGALRPYPIEDAAKVNLRRARVGIEPIEMYARTLRRIRSAPVNTTPMTEYPKR